MTTSSQNPSLAVVSNPRSSIISNWEIASSTAPEKTSRLDTIEFRNEQTGKKWGFVPKGRPTLPPGNSKNPEYLMVLAKAYSESFSAMDESVIYGDEDYANLQTLNEAMSQSVLKSTEDSMAKQLQEIQTEKSIQDLQAQQQQTNSTLGTVFMIAGIVVMVATVASMLFDGGASAAALPEELDMIEMTEMTSAAVSDAGDSGAAATSDAISDGATDTEQTADSAANDSTSATQSDSVANNTEEGTQQTQAESNTTRQVQNTTSRTAQENLKSLSRWNKFKSVLISIGKRAVGAAIGGAFGTPSLVEGLGEQQVAGKLSQLATLQQSVGEALATMQENGSYFQFFQQLVQRAGNVLQEEASDASEVVDSFSDIVSGYRQITYGLANAV